MENLGHTQTKQEVTSLRDFAAKHHLRLNDRKHERKYRLATAEDTIHGRYGEIVDDPSYGSVFAVKFIAVPRGATMNHALLSRYRLALAGGLKLKQKYGDAESTFHFDPTNATQTALAIKLVGAKHKRHFTDEQKVLMAARLGSYRANTPVAA